MIRKLLWIALPALLVLVVVNDAGRFITSRYQVDSGTRAAVDAAALDARKSHSRDSAGAAAVRVAMSEGIELYAYDQDASSVHAWTRKTVGDTFVLARAAALLRRRPIDTPFVIENEASALIQ